jgi:hypothetical protein
MYYSVCTPSSEARQDILTAKIKCALLCCMVGYASIFWLVFDALFTPIGMFCCAAVSCTVIAWTGYSCIMAECREIRKMASLHHNGEADRSIKKD